VRFRELVRIMVDADLELVGLEAPGAGRRILAERFGDWHRWDGQVTSMEQVHRIMQHKQESMRQQWPDSITFWRDKRVTAHSPRSLGLP
jgi:hypothetical protein